MNPYHTIGADEISAIHADAAQLLSSFTREEFAVNWVEPSSMSTAALSGQKVQEFSPSLSLDDERYQAVDTVIEQLGSLRYERSNPPPSGSPRELWEEHYRKAGQFPDAHELIAAYFNIECERQGSGIDLSFVEDVAPVLNAGPKMPDIQEFFSEDKRYRTDAAYAAKCDADWAKRQSKVHDTMSAGIAKFRASRGLDQ